MAVGQNIENELQNDSIGIGTVGVGPRADPNFGPARGPAPTMPNDKGKFIRSYKMARDDGLGRLPFLWVGTKTGSIKFNLIHHSWKFL